MRWKNVGRVVTRIGLLCLVCLVAERLGSAAEDPGSSLSGVVMSRAGEPVPGAWVRIRGREVSGRKVWVREDDEGERVTTDARGHFNLIAEAGVAALLVHVEAKGFAPLAVRLRAHRDPVLRLWEGAALKGRVVAPGKPAAGISLIASTVRREPWGAWSGWTAMTDAEGRFQFDHLPPDTAFSIAGSLTTAREHKLASARVVKTSKDRSVVDAGEFISSSAGKLVGKLVVRSDRTLVVPENSRVQLIRYLHGEKVTATVHPDGSFEFPFAPVEVLMLQVEAPGYRLAEWNRSLDWDDSRRLVGLWNGDVYPLKLLIEPGAPLTPAQRRSPSGAEVHPRDEVLKGAD